MANNTGTTVTETVRPKSTDDHYPVALASEIKGGSFTVASLAERDAIFAERRSDGMRVFVSANRLTYRLGADLSNGSWVDESAELQAKVDQAGVSADSALAQANAAADAANTAKAIAQFQPQGRFTVAVATVSSLPSNTYNNGAAGVGATLTGTANGALTARDGVVLVAGQNLAVKNEVQQLKNGWYRVTQVGDAGTPYILTRVAGADTPAGLGLSCEQIVGGTTNVGWVYKVQQAAADITIGVTAITFVGQAAAALAEATTRGNADTALGQRTDLSLIPWLAPEAHAKLTTNADGWFWATRPYRLQCAQAIKAIALEGADSTKQYVVAQFSYQDVTNHDRIIIADTANTTFADTGAVDLGVSATGLTKVVIAGAGGKKATLWIDYSELTVGRIYTTSSTTPLLIDNSWLQNVGTRLLTLEAQMAPLTALDASKINLRQALGQIPWLAASSYDQVANWNLAGQPYRQQVGKAIKAVELIGADPVKQYVFSQFALDDVANKDRIIISDSDGNQFATTGIVDLATNAYGITRVQLLNGAVVAAVVWVDYSELAGISGTLVSGYATSPLLIAKTSAHGVIEARVTAVESQLATIDISTLSITQALGNLSWLAPSAYAQVANWNLNTQPRRKAVAKAIKAVELIGADVTKQYVFSQFAIDDVTNHDRIIIADTGGGQFASTGIVDLAINANGITRVELLNGSVVAAVVWVDYSELAGFTGTLVSGYATSPLWVAKTSAHQIIESRLTALESGAAVSTLTLACIGDSITEFGDYPERIVARTGGTALKFGFGGCRMARHDATGEGVYKDQMCMYRLADSIASGDYTALLQAADDLYAYNGDDNRPQAALMSTTDWSQVDVLSIAFGTNDFTADNVTIGADGDITGVTFKGAINYTIQRLLTAYPNLKLVFFAPMWRQRQNTGDDKDSDTYPNTAGEYLAQYAAAVIARANASHVPAYNGYAEMGINRYNYLTFLVDGLHPRAGIGYQRVAERYYAFLASTVLG